MKNPRVEFHTYFGILIHPAPWNSSGIRWETIMPIRLRADTLAGIKGLIRDYFKKNK